MTSDITFVLNHIDPGRLPYEDWLTVGMALKTEGVGCHVWDSWSARDASRYKPGVCERKWNSFQRDDVKAGSIIEIAKRGGYVPPSFADAKAYDDWDVRVENPREDLHIIDQAFIEDADIVVPGDEWNPAHELSVYLSTLFESHEYVGYVTESWENDEGRRLPKKGHYARTAGELLHDLGKHPDDIGAVIGDYDPEVGAWIRFNPLDGQGVKNENVTAFRYALVESDKQTIERQAAIYAELELPVAVMVHSGNKSLHAIVRVGAQSKEEYRERVQFLYKVCAKNGLELDEANKNPSRLSRMPGVTRNGQKQYIVAANTGKATWEEWKAHVEEANDNLPEFESLADVFDNLPDLAPPLIEGVLREGHKLLLAGPSKLGKSFLLLQLGIGIAEGARWLGWQCKQGRVLYVNLELDRASCLHRLKALYREMGIPPANLRNLDIWNLRGSAVPMDQLAPKLIRRARKHSYTAIIIDPIYKVITGDENAADKMAYFCNQFDRLCKELGSAVIYCHHHSKGAQGHKSAQDRSSGSGVFARDPDAILDIIELTITPTMRKALTGRAVCNALANELDCYCPSWRDDFPQDDALIADKMMEEANLRLGSARVETIIAPVIAQAEKQTGWRMEGALREFAGFEARRFWFRHPIHVMDDGMLADAKAAGEEAPWVSERREKAAANVERKMTGRERLLQGWNAMDDDDGAPMIGDLAESIGVPEKHVLGWLKATKELVLCADNAIRTKKAAKTWELERAIKACTDMTGIASLVDVAQAMHGSEKTIRRHIEEHGAYEIRTGKIIRKDAV